MSYKYQLVLQFPANSIADYDEMIALEDELIVKLRTSADVDGHDCGSGEMNIFIYTDTPAETFDASRPIVAKRKLFENLTAAYRDYGGKDYTIIWPVGSAKQFRIT